MNRLFVTLLFSLALCNAAHAATCRDFRACDKAGRAAHQAGDLDAAQSYYETACFLTVPNALLNLRNNACRAVTKISGERDDYASAEVFFDHACAAGNDAGCFHRALLEADRGNLRLATDMMKPLCDRRYIIHKNVYSSGCTEYKRMKTSWHVQHPRQPRDYRIQLPLLIVTLVLPLPGVIYLALKRYTPGMVLSGLAFVSYGYYEYGVSPYAAIRLDLFLILPMLLVALATGVACAVLLWRSKPPGEKEQGS